MKNIVIVLVLLIAGCTGATPKIVSPNKTTPVDSYAIEMKAIADRRNKNQYYFDQSQKCWVAAHELCNDGNSLWRMGRKKKARIKFDSAKYMWSMFEVYADSLKK